VPVPVAARSKAWVYGRSPAETVDSNPTGGMDVCLLCVLSGRGLCDELITRPEEYYLLWCVVVCDLETSWMRKPWPTGGCCAKTNKQTNKQTNITVERLDTQPQRNGELSCSENFKNAWGFWVGRSMVSFRILNLEMIW